MGKDTDKRSQRILIVLLNCFHPEQKKRNPRRINKTTSGYVNGKKGIRRPAKVNFATDIEDQEFRNAVARAGSQGSGHELHYWLQHGGNGPADLTGNATVISSEADDSLHDETLELSESVVCDHEVEEETDKERDVKGVVHTGIT